jgi:hypothetical protein
MGGSVGESPRAPTAHDFPGLLEAVGATQISIDLLDRSGRKIALPQPEGDVHKAD